MQQQLRRSAVEYFPKAILNKVIISNLDEKYKASDGTPDCIRRSPNFASYSNVIFEGPGYFTASENGEQCIKSDMVYFPTLYYEMERIENDWLVYIALPTLFAEQVMNIEKELEYTRVSGFLAKERNKKMYMELPAGYLKDIRDKDPKGKNGCIAAFLKFGAITRSNKSSQRFLVITEVVPFSHGTANHSDTQATRSKELSALEDMKQRLRKTLRIS
ncbi:hypothetical protein ACMFMG_006133 [Clarireedia jacksonii]